MLFNSSAFAVFLPLVLAAYYVLNRRSQNVWLLLASLVFYGWWDPRFLLLLIVPTVIDYWSALRMAHAGSERSRHAYLLLSVVTNLTILGFFKYFNFFVDSAIGAFGAMGLRLSRPLLDVVLPIGISFYTFHELSYVVDVYRRHVPVVRSFTTYLLYVLYFPQLVAGPIARATSLLPQLEVVRRVGWQQLQEGLLLMLLGYFKKVGIADALAPLVDARFQNPALCSGADLLYAVYLFSLQIYCDFSGYTDIARGASKLFGIELTMNFHHPYFATSITDFWRRWHMSLSAWLRDYLYISLGGNRSGLAKTYRNLMLTMLLGGLWHGANWTFVVWGGLHGVYLSMHKFWRERGASRRRAEGAGRCSPWVMWGKAIVTFHLVALTWIFFRADSVTVAWTYVFRIVTWQPATVIEPLSWVSLRLNLLIGTLLALELSQLRADTETSLLRLHWLWRGACVAAIVLIIVIWGGIDAQVPFIYFQF